MRIAMVSEHASPLAALGGVDAGGQNVHVARWPRALAGPATTSPSTPAGTRPTCPTGCGSADGVVVEHVAAGPRRADAQGRAAAADRPSSAPSWPRGWPPTRPTWCTRTSGCPGWPALAAARRAATCRSCRPSTRSASSSGGTRARPDTSPPAADPAGAGARPATSTGSSPPATDEVGELLRLGAARQPDHGRAVRRGRRAVHPGRPGEPRAADRPRVLCIGRLVPRKGVDTVIRALAAVPDAELVIAGGPPAAELADDPEAHRLPRLAAALRRGRPGPADRRGAAAGRAGAAALGRRGRLHALVRAVRDRAAGGDGLRRAGGRQRGRRAPRHRRRRATGMLVPPRRPDRLAAAMRRLLAEPFWREAYGTAGVDRARSRYSWDRIAAGTRGRVRATCSAAAAARAGGRRRAGDGRRRLGVTLVVVGDALLDRDVTGRADRLSPDAPVPVVSELTETDRPGGAALAALLAARDGVRGGAGDRARRRSGGASGWPRCWPRPGCGWSPAGCRPDPGQGAGPGRRPVAAAAGPGGGGAGGAGGDRGDGRGRAVGAGAVLVSDYGRGLAADAGAAGGGGRGRRARAGGLGPAPARRRPGARGRGWRRRTWPRPCGSPAVPPTAASSPPPPAPAWSWPSAGGPAGSR